MRNDQKSNLTAAMLMAGSALVLASCAPKDQPSVYPSAAGSASSARDSLSKVLPKDVASIPDGKVVFAGCNVRVARGLFASEQYGSETVAIGTVTDQIISMEKGYIVTGNVTKDEAQKLNVLADEVRGLCADRAEQGPYVQEEVNALADEKEDRDLGKLLSTKPHPIPRSALPLTPNDNRSFQTLYAAPVSPEKVSIRLPSSLGLNYAP